MRKILLFLSAIVLIGGCRKHESTENESMETVVMTDSSEELKLDSSDAVQSVTQDDSLTSIQDSESEIQEKEDLKENIKKEMLSILKKEKSVTSSGGDNSCLEYFCTDFDKDGIPELWIEDFCGAHYECELRVYSAGKNGKIIKDKSGADYKIFKGKNYLVVSFEAGGGQEIFKYTLSNGKIKSKMIGEGGYEVEFKTDFKEPPVKTTKLSDTSLLLSYFDN